MGACWAAIEFRRRCRRSAGWPAGLLSYYLVVPLSVLLVIVLLVTGLAIAVPLGELGIPVGLVLGVAGFLIGMHLANKLHAFARGRVELLVRDRVFAAGQEDDESG